MEPISYINKQPTKKMFTNEGLIPEEKEGERKIVS
jgi:hypothetical protein